jgi:long-chain fatty acid transport protein
MIRSTSRVILTVRMAAAICLILAAAVATSPRAWSAGLMLYEQGTPDVGFASAGQVARAQDASTVFTNPAGTAQLKDSQLLTGLEPLFGNLKGRSVIGGGSRCPQSRID